MTTILFWAEDDQAHSLNVSSNTNMELERVARIRKVQVPDILREALALFGNKLDNNSLCAYLETDFSMN